MATSTDSDTDLIEDEGEDVDIDPDDAAEVTLKTLADQPVSIQKR